MGKKVICDTDVMIDFWDSAKARHSATRDIIGNEIMLDNVIVSVITKMELMCGTVDKKDLARLNKKLMRFNVSLLNDAISLKAIELLSKYRLSHGLGIPDCLIAATAITSGLELFTYNHKDYHYIPGLRLFKSKG